MRGQGVSLVEAIIAVFILFSAFLVIICLFHSGLRHSTRIEQQQLAVMLAQRKVEEIRAWAQTTSGGGYAFDDWTPYQGATETPADFPDFRVHTQATDQALYSSCSQLELAYPAAPGWQRKFSSSCKLLRVRVSWGQSNQLVLHSLVGSPPRRFRVTNPIVVTVGAYAAPLAHDASVTLTAQAFDSFGNALNDVTFAWNVAADNANGTLEPARDGSSAVLTNLIYSTGPNFYAGGDLRVEARASLHGQTAVGVSPVIQVAP